MSPRRVTADHQRLIDLAQSVLDRHGWRPAVVGDRPCRLDEDPDDGHFLLRPRRTREASAELICCTATSWLDLHHMVEALTEHGMSEINLGWCDSVGIRASTAEEVAQRQARRTLRVAPLLAGLLPHRRSRRCELPPDANALF
jgi:hypothetical protein